MSIYEIIENENIRSDRYAMAAISCIFKAFGDSIRSKEIWPWGKDVQCEWYPSKGTKIDILESELLLERSLKKIEEETVSENDKNIDNTYIMNLDKNITELKRKLNKLQNNISNIKNISKEVINVSNETNSDINK